MCNDCDKKQTFVFCNTKAVFPDSHSFHSKPERWLWRQNGARKQVLVNINEKKKKQRKDSNGTFSLTWLQVCAYFQCYACTLSLCMVHHPSRNKCSSFAVGLVYFTQGCCTCSELQNTSVVSVVHSSLQSLCRWVPTHFSFNYRCIRSIRARKRSDICSVARIRSSSLWVMLQVYRSSQDSSAHLD